MFGCCELMQAQRQGMGLCFRVWQRGLVLVGVETVCRRVEGCSQNRQLFVVHVMMPAGLCIGTPYRMAQASVLQYS